MVVVHLVIVQFNNLVVQVMVLVEVKVVEA
jgi:hypothetical protein